MTRLVEDIITKDQPLTGRRLLDALQAAAAMAPRGGEDIAFSDGGGSAGPVTARRADPKRWRNVVLMVEITGSTPLVGDVRWRYDWAEVLYNGLAFNTRANGLTSTSPGREQAQNLAEIRNDGAAVWGNGIAEASLPDGFMLGPIPIGRVLEMTERLRSDGSAVDYWFDYNNPIIGECA